MLFSSIMILLIAAIAYWHYVQGMFSSIISIVCSIFAAAIALAYHEKIVDALLRGRAADQAHAMVLVALFALTYLIFRVIIDTAIPGNVRLPAIVDKIGGAALGFVSAMFGIGILAIAAQMLPFGPSIGGYVRYRTNDQRDVKIPTRGQATDTETFDELFDDRTSAAVPGFNPSDSRGMVLPIDDAVVGLTSYLSEGSLSNGHPLKKVHPALLDELFGQRLGVQVGASHVTMNSQESVHVSNAYLLDKISQADDEITPGVRNREVPSPLSSDPQHTLLVLRTQMPINGADADHMFRFSPASIRLTSNSVNYLPIGTLDDVGLLRNNKPDDFLVCDVNSPVDLVFFVDRSDVFDTDGKTTKFHDDAFLAVKRMGIVDLSGVPTDQKWTPTGKKGVLRKANLPAPKPPLIYATGGSTPAAAPAAAAPANASQGFAPPPPPPAPTQQEQGAAPQGGGGFTPPPPPPPPTQAPEQAAPPQSAPPPPPQGNQPSGPGFIPPPPPPPPPGANRQGSAPPFRFEGVEVAAALPSPINIGPHENDGDAAFPSGTAKMTGNQFARLSVNGTQTIALLRQGDYVVRSIFVPEKMRLVQLKGITGEDPWQWAMELGSFSLIDSKQQQYKPHGAWAKLKQNQQDYFLAEYNAAQPVNSIDKAEGRPTDVWLVFQIPQNTTLSALNFKEQQIAVVDLAVQ